MPRARPRPRKLRPNADGTQPSVQDLLEENARLEQDCAEARTAYRSLRDMVDTAETFEYVRRLEMARREVDGLREQLLGQPVESEVTKLRDEVRRLEKIVRMYWEVHYEKPGKYTDDEASASLDDMLGIVNRGS